MPAQVFALSLGACGAKVQAAEPGVTPSEALPPSEAPSPPPPEPALAPAPRSIEFAALEGAENAGADAHVEILFPFAEQKLKPERAREFVVRLKVESWRADLVDVSLDDFVPRRRDTLKTPLRLGDLVPENQELQPGEHLLVATAVHEDGKLVRAAEPRSRAPFAAVRFWVGERGTPDLDLQKPFVVYRQPRGTYNGPEAADRVLVDFLVLGGSLGSALGARIAVSGKDSSGSTLLRKPGPVVMRDLASGDYTIELSLVGADDTPLGHRAARAARTITVNRDAPIPGKKP